MPRPSATTSISNNITTAAAAGAVSTVSGNGSSIGGGSSSAISSVLVPRVEGEDEEDAFYRRAVERILHGTSLQQEPLHQQQQQQQQQQQYEPASRPDTAASCSSSSGRPRSRPGSRGTASAVQFGSVFDSAASSSSVRPLSLLEQFELRQRASEEDAFSADIWRSNTNVCNNAAVAASGSAFVAASDDEYGEESGVLYGSVSDLAPLHPQQQQQRYSKQQAQQQQQQQQYAGVVGGGAGGPWWQQSNGAQRQQQQQQQQYHRGDAKYAEHSRPAPSYDAGSHYSSSSGYTTATTATAGASASAHSHFFDRATSTADKGRYRVADARHFLPDGMRRAEDATAGVTLLLGREAAAPHAERPITVMFDRGCFNEAEAAQWWARHRERLSGAQ
jgi:hypothetical protein